MTDKEIIIDDKTIGCPCYIDRPLYRYDKACSIQSQAFTEQQTKEKPILRCDQIKNCPIKEIYKQLKRKEQECEELKEDRERWKSNFNGKVSAIKELLQQLDQLIAENEKMKKQVCDLRPELKYIIDKTCSKYNIESKYYHEKIVEIINNLDKYEQTLTEIKFLVRELLKRTGQVVPYEIKRILQKISEVNNDRKN